MPSCPHFHFFAFFCIFTHFVCLYRCHFCVEACQLNCFVNTAGTLFLAFSRLFWHFFSFFGFVSPSTEFSPATFSFRLHFKFGLHCAILALFCLFLHIIKSNTSTELLHNTTTYCTLLRFSSTSMKSTKMNEHFSRTRALLHFLAAKEVRLSPAHSLLLRWLTLVT